MNKRSSEDSNRRTRHVSLPTLFEYGDTNMGELRGEKTLLKIANSPEKSRKNISRLPSLTDNTKQCNVPPENENNYLLEVGQASDYGVGIEESTVSVNEDSDSDDVVYSDDSSDDAPIAVEDGGKVTGNERPSKPRVVGINRVRKLRLWDLDAAKDQDLIKQKENTDKMKSVCHWIRQQSFVNSVPKLNCLEEIREKAVLRIPLINSDVTLNKELGGATESWNMRAKEKNNFNAGRMAKGTRTNTERGLKSAQVESELSTKLSNSRHRKKNVVAPGHSCGVANEEPETARSIGALVQTRDGVRFHAPTPPRCGTPFPAKNASKMRRYSLSSSYPSQKEIGPHHKGTNGPARAMTAFSWPESIQGGKRRQFEESLHKRSSTPSPPADMVRSLSIEL